VTVALSHAGAEALILNKPVVVLKSGTSEIGARVAQTHSGALLADDDMVQATLDRVGALRVNSLPELDETLKMLTTTQRAKGRRVAVLTNSGGEKALAADAAVGTVIEFPAPSLDVAADLASQIPEFAVVSNPFDYNAYFAGAGPEVLGEEAPDLLTKCFRTMVADDYDVAIMLSGFRSRPEGVVEHPGTRIDTWVDAVRDLDVAAVMASVLPEHMPSVIGKQLIEHGVAPLQGIQEAMRAVHHAIVWEQRRCLLLTQSVEQIGLREVPQLGAGRILETERISKQVLASYGLSIPKGQVCKAGDVQAAADEIGYPVVLKINEPVVAHKVRADGVALNIRDAAQMDLAVDTMQAASSANGAVIRTFLVEQMVSGTRLELIAGIKFDARFGHALLFGRGGSAVELINDVGMMLLPASRDSLEALVTSTAVAEELAPPTFDAVVDALAAISMMVDDKHGEIVSLDVNPLIVTTTGEIVAVDALLELAI
jgi:acyl-CoA synthetase (NDP forming)